eukprot:Protomagalhaensia_sp_Gyna_25__5568@NODE_761_length_2675_cov_24_925266_g597_i0_p3_GENE_NODE_761_length_2675_cov_24_925266_g597_i0NODE_761_length_2675_cov_24_925266_g597_i0_p3_ORF_typecomplete_len116_score17_73_NODE_761_length_2675_cov_24_925266_g597_i0302649
MHVWLNLHSGLGGSLPVATAFYLPGSLNERSRAHASEDVMIISPEEEDGSSKRVVEMLELPPSLQKIMAEVEGTFKVDSLDRTRAGQLALLASLARLRADMLTHRLVLPESLPDS